MSKGNVYASKTPAPALALPHWIALTKRYLAVGAHAAFGTAMLAKGDVSISGITAETQRQGINLGAPGNLGQGDPNVHAECAEIAMRVAGAAPMPKCADEELACRMKLRDGTMDLWPGGFEAGYRLYDSIKWRLRGGAS